MEGRLALKKQRAIIAVASACALASACGKSDVNSKSSIGSSSNAMLTSQPSQASSGPFGISMGAPLSSVGPSEATDKGGTYAVKSPPNPSDDFPQVAVEAFPSTGICKIYGVGEKISGDNLGDQLRGRMSAVAEALQIKYGSSRKIDECANTCESQFWTMSIEQGERRYGYEWGHPKTMPGSLIGEIKITTTVELLDPRMLILYQSANKVGCAKAENAAKAGSL